MKHIYFRFLFFFNSLISTFLPYRTVRFLNGKFKMRISSNNELLRALTFKEKEPETLSWIDKFKKDYDGAEVVFYDVGANVGIYSLYASCKHTKAKIFAFEPDSQSFSSLSQNIFINRFNVYPYPFALNNSTGIGKVMISSMNAGAGACSLGEKYSFSDVNESDVFEQGVFFVSLDDLVLKYDFPFPNYIKIDVDGLEAMILEGANEILKSDLLKSILVEFQYLNEADLDPLIAKLEVFGLNLSKKSDWISTYDGWSSRNYIFSK